MSTSVRLYGRQFEVVRWAAEGDSNEQIAARMGVSVDTVKTHLRKAYGRLGVNSRAGAVAAGFRAGWLR